MGTTAEKLNYLEETKTTIAQAIGAKGVLVPEDTPFREYADKIGLIGGAVALDGSGYLVQFIGLDGQVLQSGWYETGDVVQFPEEPSYDGLVFQSWSSPVAVTDGTITVGTQDVTVGAVLGTASGNLEITFTLNQLTGKTIGFQNMTNVTSIEFGDGTSGEYGADHTYADYGTYTASVSGSEIGITGFILYATSGVSMETSVTAVGLDGVGTMAPAVFMGCKSLSSITISDGVTAIAPATFMSCQCTSITIPNSVTTIGPSAFTDCRSLTNIIIPDSVAIIDGSAFADCRSLTNIIIPDSVTTIANGVFSECRSLAHIVIPDSVTTIDTTAFGDCTAEIIYDFTAFSATDTVPTLGDFAFSDMTNLARMIFSDQATLDNFATATSWSAFADYMYVEVPDVS